jgi:hypothetical protein
MQSHQLHLIGFDNILSDLIPTCIEKEWSKASSEKLTTHNNTWIARVMVQQAVEVDAGCPFVHATYQTEGDDPLILSGYIVFDRLDKVVDAGVDDLHMPNVAKAAAKAVLLVNVQRTLFANAIAVANAEFEEATEETMANYTALEAYKKQIADEDDQHANGGSTSRQRTARVPLRFRDTAVELQREENIAAMMADRQELEDEGFMKLEVLESEESKLAAWELSTPLKTANDFVQHARLAAEPAFEYYRKNFQDTFGDMYQMRLACETAKLFDPFFLATADMTVLEMLVDNLSTAFGYLEFQDKEFSELLKLELPAAVADARDQFNWDEVDGSKAYDRRLLRRKLRAAERQRLEALSTPVLFDDNAEEGAIDDMLEQDDRIATQVEDTYMTWMDDPGERSRRILCWWQARLVKVKTHRFKSFTTALRLVLLTQLSSAFVERVFSRLERVTRGKPKIYEDTLNMRILLRTNGEHLQLFPDLHSN